MWPSGARTLRAVNAPGMLAGSGSGGHSGRRWPALARREQAPPPRLPTVAQPLASAVNQAAELRLCSNPPQPYAHIVILAAQKAANR